MRNPKRFLVTVFLLSSLLAIYPSALPVGGTRDGPTLSRSNFSKPYEYQNGNIALTNSVETITLVPPSGRIGTYVSISGSGFSSTDSSCKTSSPVYSFLLSAECRIKNGAVSGSFIVGNVIPGQYDVQVRGNSGDSAEVVFKVVDAASMVLNSTSGTQGSIVGVNGSGFLPTDGPSCGIASPSAGVILRYNCTMTPGQGLAQASFVVGKVGTGRYLIQLSGGYGDFANAVLNVTGAIKISGQTSTQTTTSIIIIPTMSLSPSPAMVGETVGISGSSFSTSDTSCTLSGSAVATSSCNASGGALIGNFVVANVATGSYNVTVTGSPAGDSASATLTVSGGSGGGHVSLSFNPSSAAVGSGIQLFGSGFSGSDTSCILSGSPISFPTCSIYSGTLVGSFTVANVAIGSYTITATGTQAGDHASARFTVSGGAPTITLNPASGPAGSTVQVSGSGFASGDTGCSLSDGGSISSESCSISDGTLTGSFVVANKAVGSYVILANAGPQNDFASATFTISTTSQTSTTALTTSTTSVSTTKTATTTSITTTVSSNLKATTTLTLLSSIENTQVTLTVHLTATFHSLTGPAPGKGILISTSWGLSGSCVTKSDGTCRVTFSKPATGTYTVTARFVGDSYFAASTAKISLKT